MHKAAVISLLLFVCLICSACAPSHFQGVLPLAPGAYQDDATDAGGMSNKMLQQVVFRTDLSKDAVLDFYRKVELDGFAKEYTEGESRIRWANEAGVGSGTVIHYLVQVSEFSGGTMFVCQELRAPKSAQLPEAP